MGMRPNLLLILNPAASKLKKLTLSESFLSHDPFFTRMVLKPTELGNVLMAATSLEMVEFRKIRLHCPDNDERLSYYLSFHPTLIELSLIQCFIGDPGVELLVSALDCCVNLEKLNLRGNEIGNAAIFLGDIIPSHPALTYLDLGDNNLGDNEAISLLLVMCLFNTLMYLKLDSNCHITAAVMISLVETYNYSTSIKQILLPDPWGLQDYSELHFDRTAMNRRKQERTQNDVLKETLGITIRTF